MRKLPFLSAFATILLLAGFGCGPVQPTPAPGNTNTAVNSPNMPPAAAFGTSVTLSVGEYVTYAGDLVVRLETINDSRCKDGVVCIWEGELSATLRLGLGAEAPTVILGTSRTPTATHEGHSFKLDAATETTATITVTQGSTTPPVTKGDCRPSGCSGQICADEDMASDCMYRPEYACYKTATCERQADGKCGWTSSDALTACLANPEPVAAE